MSDESLEGPAVAVHAWAAAFNATDLAGILALYAPGAVLWGTLATELVDSRAALRAYFQRALSGSPSPGVEIRSLLVQPFDGTAVASGSYVLRLGSGDQRREFPARFTFVLERVATGWRIVSHHSSAMPAGSGGA